MYTPPYTAAILFRRRLRLEAHADWKFPVGTPLLGAVKHRRLAESPGMGIGFLFLALSLSTGCGGGQVDTDTPVLTQAPTGIVEAADGGATEQTPVTTPGDSRIAFSSTSATKVQPGQGARTTGTFNIHVMDIDGSNQTNVSDHPRKDENPDWSPDGSKIAYDRVTLAFRRREGGPGTRDIFLMNADGSEQTNLTNDLEADYREPDWSSDGTKIAFFTFRDGDGEIYLMNPDGSGPTRLTNVPGSDASPDWSPDGAKIAFVSSRDGDAEIYTMNADGSNETRVTDRFGEDVDPAWSPDGTKIAFVSDRDGPADIFVMDADGSNPVNLTNGTRDDRQPSWSGDGAHIVFWSLRDDGDPEIYVMDADGSNQTRLTRNEGPDVAPAWLGGS